MEGRKCTQTSELDDVKVTTDVMKKMKYGLLGEKVTEPEVCLRRGC